jgi:hypothetical protein
VAEKQQVTHRPEWLGRVLELIHEEYEEMPGLCLTPPQAQRLWALDADTLRAALGRMVESGYLRESRFGYVRAH